MSELQTRHPAKYSDEFLPIFAEKLAGVYRVLDPFAGVGKLGEIKKHGFNGIVYANEIEPEWAALGLLGGCDVVTRGDAEYLGDIYAPGYFDAICTSPTHGNRMADHHEAKDGSRRNTYKHCLGHNLTAGNTGAMQWGEAYREKHERIYAALAPLVKTGGLFVLNVSDHIRKGEQIHVSDWHRETLERHGFRLIDDVQIETRRNRFGANADKRVSCEHIFTLKKERVA